MSAFGMLRLSSEFHQLLPTPFCLTRLLSLGRASGEPLIGRYPSLRRDQKEYKDDETEEVRFELSMDGEVVGDRMMTKIHLGDDALMTMRMMWSRKRCYKRLARCMAPLAYSSPLLPSSGCPTQIQTLRIASTQALIDAVTAALPSPPLPPLPPSLYIPPPVDHRDEIPKSEQPPRKRLCLSTLGSRYEVGESSTARPTRSRGIDYGFVSTVDAEERRQGIRDVGYGIRDTWVDPAEAVPKIAPVTLGEVNTRVTELAELYKHDTQDLYALLEDTQDRESMDGGGGGLCFPRGLGSLDRIESGNSSGASDPSCQDQMVETLRVIRDMRREMSDKKAELLSLRKQQRRARQLGPEARIPDQDAFGDADRHI
ncbi:hypothetical protein Tco_1406787 [Tanacetum coccineum]